MSLSTAYKIEKNHQNFIHEGTECICNKNEGCHVGKMRVKTKIIKCRHRIHFTSTYGALTFLLPNHLDCWKTNLSWSDNPSCPLHHLINWMLFHVQAQIFFISVTAIRSSGGLVVCHGYSSGMLKRKATTALQVPPPIIGCTCDGSL